MNIIAAAIVAIIVVLLYVMYLMPLIPAPFGVLLLMLIVVVGLAYAWKYGGFNL